MFFKAASNPKMQEIRAFIPASSATSFANIEPFIKSATVTFIRPILGDSLYNQLLQLYTDPANPPEGVTPENLSLFTEALTHVQRALINLTYWSSFDFMNTLMNDSGFHRQESDTEKGLFKYQEESLKMGFKNNGFDGLDILLTFLESNIEAFPLFKTSPNYTLRKASIIPNTAAFNSIIDINNSRLVFLKLSRFITQVEDFNIQAALGAALYQRVKTELAKESPDPKILQLQPILQKPLAYLAMARAGFQLGINVTDKGLFFESQNSTFQNSTVITPLTDQQYYRLSKASEDTGMAYLDMLHGFILANAADYPDYSNPAGSPFIRNNLDKKTCWL